MVAGTALPSLGIQCAVATVPSMLVCMMSCGGHFPARPQPPSTTAGPSKQPHSPATPAAATAGRRTLLPWGGSQWLLNERDRSRNHTMPFYPHHLVPSLRECPSTGAGVHRWLFTTARDLHRCGFTPDKSVELLRYHSSKCGRIVRDREIREAVRDSAPHAVTFTAGSAGRSGNTSSRLGHWPKRNYGLIYNLAAKGPSLQELRARSPVVLSQHKRHTEAVIGRLFPGDPLLCCGFKNNVHTKRRFTWWHRHIMGLLPFIVPSPMSAEYGFKKDGGRSARCLSNTGPRKNLVVEFDFKIRLNGPTAAEENAMLVKLQERGIGVLDLCAALTCDLMRFHRPVLVVYSGGKSLHTWFPVSRTPEDWSRKFMEYAVSIGADPATWTRCQLVRMPDGTREDGTRQEIIYFDPAQIRE